MERLFTFGCSFTSYAWPSYADLFGLEFDQFENWGVPGIGNVAISNRVAECNLKNNFTKDDIVVVQWTSHLRNDYHMFRQPPKGRDTEYNWKTKGGLFSYTNKDLYDKKWIDNFFDEKSYVMLTLNAIYSTIKLLETTDCNWKMTTIGDFAKLGSDYNIPSSYGEAQNSNINLWQDLDFLPYKKILDNENWIDPIGLYCWKSQELLYEWKDFIDPHPSPALGIDWLYNVLKPSLNIDNSKLTLEQKDCVNTCDALKQNIDDLQMYGDVLYRELSNFDKTYRGY